ncbi:MAG: FHA domain-containing protein [Pseudomonadales bacterium]|jgi:hypothetical protein|nr:FHA domain-containing protein [Pseudomonadales bacterium]
MARTVEALASSITAATRLAGALCVCAALSIAPHAHADRVVLLVDNSGSMQENDPDRLVPEAVKGFVAGLPAKTEVAVVAFDTGARLLAPLAPAEALQGTDLAGLDYEGTLADPASAVERALYELRERPARPAGRDVIVLLTDGVIDLGDPGASLRAGDWLLGDLREQLVARGVGVWAIALTDAADFRLLSQLTEPTGGRYYRALAATEVETALARIGRDLGLDASAPTATGAAAGAVTTPPEAATAAPMEARLAAAASAGPGQAGEARGASLRWWLAFAFLAIGVVLLGWVSVSTWRDRRRHDTAEEPALEYFPDCYLVDLHGVTDRPTHRLSGKYNMITRLQNPPDDGINYIQVFRRQIGRRHALIEYRDFSFWIIDQNSLNGTFLNGERLTSETRLKHGDRLRFHIFEFEFCVSDLALSNETLIEQERAASSR